MADESEIKVDPLRSKRAPAASFEGTWELRYKQDAKGPGLKEVLQYPENRSITKSYIVQIGMVIYFLADPGEARGCSTNISVID